MTELPIQPTNERSNLNTVLLYVTLGTLAFIGCVSYNTAISVAEVRGAQITRPEFETKLADINSRITQTNADVAKLQVQVAGLQTDQQKQ